MVLDRRPARHAEPLTESHGTYFEHSPENIIESTTSPTLAKREQIEYILFIGGFIAYAASIT
jgi:hypothetical protein